MLKKPQLEKEKIVEQIKQKNEIISNLNKCYIPENTIIKNKSRKTERIISGKDRRKKVKNSSKFPYSATVVISINNGEKFGSGQMIYKKSVLTAAHNLFIFNKDNNSKEKAKKVQISPGAYETNNKFYDCEIFIPKEFEIDDGNNSEDYAILIVKAKCFPEIGYFGLSIVKEFKTIQENEISIIGYPGEKQFLREYLENCLFEMWEMKIKVDKEKNNFILDKYFLRYSIDTTKMESGSGIILIKDNNYQIFGVHVGEFDNKHNLGISINEKRLENIQKWILEGLNLNNEINENGIQVLLNQDNSKSIDLSFENLGTKAIEYLTNINLDKYEILKLNYNNISNEGLELLTKLKFVNLHELYLKNNKITDKIFLNLKNFNFQKLKILNLSQNNISHIGIEFLGNKTLNNLTTLNLENNNISDEGLEKLSKNKTLKNLEVFNLANNKISHVGINSLKKIILENLKILNLSKNKITNIFIDNLTKVILPKIEDLYLDIEIIRTKDDGLLNGEGFSFFLNIKLNNFKSLYFGNVIKDKDFNLYIEKIQKKFAKAYIAYN